MENCTGDLALNNDDVIGQDFACWLLIIKSIPLFIKLIINVSFEIIYTRTSCTYIYAVENCDKLKLINSL